MKKILLIDDRSKRQIEFKKQTNIDVNNIDVLDNFTENKYQEILTSFENNDFLILNNYDVIITHRSAFNNKIWDKLQEICQKDGKKLVFFSGGISDVNYKKDCNFEFLLINAKLFYSQNLIKFIKKYQNNIIEIRILAYGDNWEYDFILELIDKITNFMGKNSEKESTRYQNFKDETNLSNAQDLITLPQVELKNGFIKLDELKKIAENIKNQLLKKIKMKEILDD